MDLVGNFVVKSNYRRYFREWLIKSLEDFRQKGESLPAASISIGKRDIKEEVLKWLAKAWEDVPSELLGKGWAKIHIHKCWLTPFQAEAEANRARLSTASSAPEREISDCFYRGGAGYVGRSTKRVRRDRQELI